MTGIYLSSVSVFFFFFLCFFFQAEDGIRDRDVTGVRRVLFRSTLHTYSRVGFNQTASSLQITALHTDLRSKISHQHVVSRNLKRCWPEQSTNSSSLCQGGRFCKLPIPPAARLSAPYSLLTLIASFLTVSQAFNSLFKVLFIFPSRYLFAIGLVPIFSFRWYLPPILGCNPKQPDSSEVPHTGSPAVLRGSHPLRRLVPKHLDLGSPSTHSSKLQFALRRFQIWALPASLAVTKGILVSFFSSAY